MRALLVASLLVVGCKKTGGEKLPSADAVFERYLDAAGGVDALRALQNLRTEVEVSIPAQGMSMQMVILQERPDRSRSEVSLPMLGSIVSGYADGIAWEVSPMTGPRIKAGDEAIAARRTGRIDLYEDFRSAWPERAVVGVVEHAGVRCHQIDAKTDTGSPETIFFAVDTGLYMGSITQVATDMGPMEVINEVLAYEPVDGVSMPARTRQRVGPAEMLSTLKKVEANLDPFPDLTPPPEILALQ